MIGGTLAPSPPPVKEIKNVGATPPSGRSVAGTMVKNARASQRGQQPRVPRPHQQQQPKQRIPRAGGGPKNPYNALNSPYRTQGEFNKAVKQTARAGYEPKLNELKTEEEGEKGLSAQRESDNVNIYKQYAQQANEGFEKAKGTLAEIAARSNASTAAGQQTLQAALSNTGVSGLQGVSNPPAFMSEASGLGTESNQVLAGEQSGITSEMAKDLLVPGAGLREATNEEQSRNAGQLNKFAAERDKLTREIPNITEKTRQEMMKDEETRQANRLQAQIAEQKLGIEKEAKVEVGKEKNQLVREANKEKNEAAERIKREEAGIKEQTVQNQKKALEEKVLQARDKKEEAIAKLEAKRYDNGLKLMAEYLKENPKTEYRPGAINPSEQQIALREGKVEYRRDAEHLYKMLTEQGNLTAPEAFRLMASSGNGYVELYAREHEHIYNEQNRTNQILHNAGKAPTQHFRVPKTR